MWASTVPAAIDAFVAKLQALAATDLAGVGLRDGPRVVADGKLEAITVGFTTQDDTTAVEQTLQFEGLSIAPLREQYTIRCAVDVVDGAGDITRARVRAYQILSVVGGVLAADETLSVGGVLSTRLADVTLRQSQDSGGTATLLFTVDVDAYTAE